jgi:hypothetical protein
VAPQPLIQILKKPPEAVRQYAEARLQRQTGERCEFCGVGIDDEHGHLVDLPRRALLCVCRPCYLLFTHEGAGGARFRAVPTRYVLLPEAAAAGPAWDALDLPIGLAFFFRNSATGRTTAFYPSPAGATESELPLDAWDALANEVTPLSTLMPDVEALLTRRMAAGITALIVPIDVCYELVGLIRVMWHGMQGGDELWARVEEFFARAIERAQQHERTAAAERV